MALKIYNSEYVLGDDPDAIYMDSAGLYYVLGEGNTPSHAYENRVILSDRDVEKLKRQADGKRNGKKR
ncbi:MAG: hypothetical protein IJ507_01055 [Clostridia bacterium]|nr:hypothetical protein [Clostridia bacterium]